MRVYLSVTYEPCSVKRELGAFSKNIDPCQPNSGRFGHGRFGQDVLARTFWPGCFGQDVLARTFWPGRFGHGRFGQDVLATDVLAR